MKSDECTLYNVIPDDKFVPVSAKEITDDKPSIRNQHKGNINKWYNGKHELGTEMITYIAKVLCVNKDENHLGIKPEADYLKDEIWRLIPFFRN